MDPEHDPRLYVRIRATLAREIREGKHPGSYRPCAS